MSKAVCPVCGKSYSIPKGRGREMVFTKFLMHKDNCTLPAEDEFVKVGGRIGIVIETQVGKDTYPVYEVQMPSGKANVFRASEITRLNDQEYGRRTFFD